MQRRKFVIGLGALATGAAAATGTGAFTAAQLGGRDFDMEVNTDENALIQLHPGLPNGDPSEGVDERVSYDDGQLAISYSGGEGNGVNPNSIYQVGAIDDTMVGAFTDYASNQASLLTEDDVLYGSAGPVGTDGGEDDPAFTIVNGDTMSHDIELFYEPGDDDPTGDDEVEVALVASGDDKGAFVFPLFGQAEDPGRLGAFPLGSGQEVYVSILVKVGDWDGGIENFGGNLALNAGETVDINKDVQINESDTNVTEGE